MITVPSNLQDAKQLLTQEGFSGDGLWYHGTSSGLLDSINAQGLKRSGDKAIKQAAKKTMATIGNSYTETTEPVFLTQSKELAYYWAQEAVKQRSVRFDGHERPVVLSVALPKEEQSNVKPDVGAASMYLIEGNDYLSFVSDLYQSKGLVLDVLGPSAPNRMDYLNKLGMAYIDKDIAAEYIEELSS